MAKAPTVDEIAAAQFSRRMVHPHLPAVGHLLIDATLGVLNGPTG